MKRRPVAVLGLLAAALALLSPAIMPCIAGQDGAGLVTLEKLYDQQDQALANQDAEKFLSLLDPADYVFVDEKDKRSSYQQYRDGLLKAMPARRNIGSTTTVKDVHDLDGKLVAHVEQTSHYELKTDKDGWVPFIETSTAEESWVNKKGEWKLALTKTLRSRLTVEPQWLKTRQEIIDGWYNAAHSAINSCNYSISGCR